MLMRAPYLVISPKRMNGGCVSLNEGTHQEEHGLAAFSAGIQVLRSDLKQVEYVPAKSSTLIVDT